MREVASVSRGELFSWYVKTAAPVMKKDGTVLEKVVPGVIKEVAPIVEKVAPVINRVILQ